MTSHSQTQSSDHGAVSYRNCSQTLPLDILWVPRSSLRAAGSAGGSTELAECVLVVGVARPRLAAALLTVALLSLFLTFHVLYDSAVYSLQAASIASANEGRRILQARAIQAAGSTGAQHPMAGVRARRRPPTRSPSRPIRRLPQALVVGVRKCGTRALLEMLYLHPMVQKAAGEVHFFDRDENYANGLEWYRSKMPLSYKGQITIEKSPSYFVTPEVRLSHRHGQLVDNERFRVAYGCAEVKTVSNLEYTLQRFANTVKSLELFSRITQVPERIRAMNASVRLLLIVREPVTRAISDYTQLRSRATPSGPAPPVVALTPALAPGSMATRPFEHLALTTDGDVNVSYKPIAISLYHSYLLRWLEVFPREQILVVNGDSLIEDPVPQLRRIETFLGLEHKIGRHNFYFNETKGFYCLRNDTADKCLRETKGRRHPRVDPAVVTKLRKFFVEHNQKFYELVGEDLGWPED